jgi:hypothetical protein
MMWKEAVVAEIEVMSNLSPENQCLGRESNRAPTKLKTEALPTELVGSVRTITDSGSPPKRMLKHYRAYKHDVIMIGKG